MKQILIAVGRKAAILTKQRAALLALWAICQVANVIAAAWMLCAALAGSPRAWRLAVSYDQLANTAFGGNEDETISSRCGRLRSRQPYAFLRAVIDGLFFWDKYHCYQSYVSELERRQSPPEERHD